MWMFLTAEGTGSFLLRYTKGQTKQIYLPLKEFCDYIFINILSIKE
jgi:hypothetical protein